MEEFRSIKGYKNLYEISNYGRVKSLSKKVKCAKGFRTTTEKILKNKKQKNNYLSIQLKNKGKCFLIHRLVAIAFIPNPENKPCVNHKNGIKTDNRVENLEWCTQSENQIHAYRTGLQKVSKHKRASGEKQGLSKLNWSSVNWIRSNYKKGDGILLANKFKVSQVSILNVVNYKTWKDERTKISI